MLFVPVMKYIELHVYVKHFICSVITVKDSGKCKFMSLQTVEGRTIAVARHVSQQLQQSVARVSSILPGSLQPAAVQERLQEAKNFTEDLYKSFQKVRAKNYFENPSKKIMQQLLEKIITICL